MKSTGISSSTTIRLDSRLIAEAEVVGKKQTRPAPKQIEHWARMGKILEDNPDLSYEFVQGILQAQAEKELGLLTEYHFGKATKRSTNKKL